MDNILPSLRVSIEDASFELKFDSETDRLNWVLDWLCRIVQPFIQQQQTQLASLLYSNQVLLGKNPDGPAPKQEGFDHGKVMAEFREDARKRRAEEAPMPPQEVEDRAAAAAPQNKPATQAGKQDEG